ncbi:CKLF-like MARVEL transmembrane domain-containing protein 7 isoform X2 [Pantherophis guttatus]|uniref:CKLF-like MARVEL transmembrane domain-containing protein 7 isoform X2 n=1 Tax=Pantherophis guttatus TaxID=94885 RepID=A0ABM3YU09_PANGU|nr:CKLF-like MARVEL transmembrane domain-containing protein 7 isoform X2 [Pantherophis guttatus]
MRVIRTDASSGGSPSSSAPLPLSYGPDTGLLDRGYAGSCSAMLKVAQMLLLLIGFICVRSSQWTDHNAYSYFEIVCVYDLIMIFIFYIIYIFRAYRKLTCIRWPLAVFGFLATFMCFLSIWLSYEVSCNTQSADATM